MNSLCSSGRCTGRFQEKRSGLTYVQRLKSTDRSLLDTSGITFFQFESYKTLLIHLIMGQSYGTHSNFKDAPQKPDVVSMTLREKSLWDKFVEAREGLTPEIMMAELKVEKDRIMEKVKERGYITKEEADFMNKVTHEKVTKVVNDFKEKITKEVAISPGDTAEKVAFKTSFLNKLVQWFQSLLDWIAEKITSILSTIQTALENTWEAVTQFFDYLWSQFV